MNQIRWTERTFSFDFPSGLYPELIERLRGTPARVVDRLQEVDGTRVNQRHGTAWSIQEHIGHLADLDDALFLVRLEEYLRGMETLLPADMSNRITEEGNHNAKSLEEVLRSFRNARARLVEKLEMVEPTVFSRSAFHPRLKTQLRLVDLMFFQAEHDDHHLATITGILRTWG